MWEDALADICCFCLSRDIHSGFFWKEYPDLLWWTISSPHSRWVLWVGLFLPPPLGVERETQPWPIRAPTFLSHSDWFRPAKLVQSQVRPRVGTPRKSLFWLSDSGGQCLSDWEEILRAASYRGVALVRLQISFRPWKSGISELTNLHPMSEHHCCLQGLVSLLKAKTP